MNSAFSLFNKRFFWPIIAVTVFASILFTRAYFTHNNPIALLSITMDRSSALTAAQEIHEAHEWLPQNPHNAALFEEDTKAQYFVELECGGANAFARMLKEHDYEAFTWHVRHFQEKETHESHVYFTPDGTPYGFYLILPETELLPSLAVDEAREKAQAVARDEWGIAFEKYHEVEASKETHPCGRIDHTFVYERTDSNLGTEGRYRLTLEVSGDQVTEVMHSVFVPESFTRSFQELRTSNDIISLGGAIGYFVLYLFCGIFIAGFYFIRKQRVHFKHALYWGLTIGALAGLSVINQFPLAWMSYNTATSINSFLISFAFSVIQATALSTFLFGFIFAICLTWDRIAFPTHLRFWNLWSSTLGASKEVFYLTIFGFFATIIFVAESIGLPLLFTDYFGWWSPSGSFSNPNILATYFPWLDAFTNSLQAGFSEEALFRALPIAVAILAGRYFKRERLGLVIGFIIQGLIFAACHANYPQMPGYYRLVELQSCSLMFGLLYLYWGLLPGIIAHFSFDFFLMSLPVFVAQGSSALFNQGIIVLLMLVPLIIVLVRRLQRGSWYSVQPNDFYGEELIQEELLLTQPSSYQEKRETSSLALVSPFLKRSALVGGLLGICLIALFAPKKTNVPPLTLSRQEALSLAHQAFAAESLQKEGLSFHPYCYAVAIPSLQEKFVWETQGKETFERLEGSYLTPPSWAIRYCSFTGPLIDRSTEYTVVVNEPGKIYRSCLTLPESLPGESLLQGEARGVALQAVQEQLGISLHDLKEVSAVSDKKPERLNWTFTFQDKREKLQEGGEARITVALAGNKVINITRSIFVPEEWTRKQQDYQLSLQHFATALSILLNLFYLAALFILRKKLFSSFALRQTLFVVLFLVTLALFMAWNKFEPIIATVFTTTQPFSNQAFTFFSSAAVTALFLYTCMGTYFAHVTKTISSSIDSTRSVALISIGFTLLTEGALIALAYFIPKALPLTGDYLPLDRTTMIGTSACVYLIGFLYTFSMNSLFLYAINTLEKTYQLSYKTLIPLLLIVGFVVGAQPFLAHSYMSSSCILGSATAIGFTFLYLTLVRKDQSSLIMIVATSTTLSMILKGIQRTFPGALLLYGGTALVGLALSYLFFKQVRKHKTLAK